MATKRRKLLDSKEKENLVAVQFQNGIGNFVMLTPAIKALAKHCNAKVDVILDKTWRDSRRQSIEDFCEGWEIVNEVKEFQNGFDKDKYSQLFYAYHGEKSESHTFFKDNAEIESDHINWRAEKLHEVDYYMNMVFKMGYRGPIPKQHYVIGGSGTFRSEILDSEYLRIGLCNGYFAGSRWQWERKGWPYFLELSKALKRYFKGRMKIFLFGKGKVEAEWANKIEKKVKVVNLVDALDLTSSTQYLQYMDLFITTDTGLMHLADAMDVPMIALFGATLVSKNGPYEKEYRIVRSALSCVPCQQSPAFSICKEWKCMEALTPGFVMAEVRSYTYDLVARGKLRTRKSGGELKPCLLSIGRSQP